MHTFKWFILTGTVCSSLTTERFPEVLVQASHTHTLDAALVLCSAQVLRRAIKICRCPVFIAWFSALRTRRAPVRRRSSRVMGICSNGLNLCNREWSKFGWCGIRKIACSSYFSIVNFSQDSFKCLTHCMNHQNKCITNCIRCNF